MSVALVFPGQGSDVSGVVDLWRARSDAVRALLDVAADATAEPVGRLTSARSLARTEWQQPVLTAVGAGIFRELEARAAQPAAVAGHSLGEVAACVAAGALDPAAAVRLAAVRGRLMAREAACAPGGMLALRAAAAGAALEAVALARRHGRAALAAHNGPGEWVVSGDWPALRALAARPPAGVAVAPMPVAGAWHSELMAGAVDEYRAALETAIGADARLAVPLVCNHTGAAVARADELPGLLAAQLVHPVRWADGVETLAALGVDAVLLVGPARGLRRPTAAALAGRASLELVERPDDLERVSRAPALAAREARVS